MAVGAGGELYAGGEAGQVYRIDPGGEVEEIARLEGFVAGVALDGVGNLYVCDTVAGRVVRIAPGGPIIDYTRGESIGYPNFAAFDSRGNLFLTDSGDYYGSDGRLLLVSPDGEVEVLIDADLHYPNGLAIDPAGEWLFLAQSGASNVLRCPIDGNSLGDREIYATIPGAVPDGLALSVAGSLYIGCYTPDAIYRVGPDREVELFIADPRADLLNRPTNLAFGDGVLYYANLGGYHVGVVPVDEVGAALFLPIPAR